MRLGQGQHRTADARPEPGAQPRLGQLLHRWQPRHPRIAGLRPQGRRHRAFAAAAGGGRRMEGAGRRMPRRQQRHHAWPNRAQHQLRQGGRSRRQAHAAGQRAAEGPEGLEAHRQAGHAPGHQGQTHRRAGLRHGPQAARIAQRRHQGLSGLRRQGQELRCRSHRQPPRREEGGGGGRQRGGGGGRHLVACEDRARCAAHRLGRGCQRHGQQQRVCRSAEGRSRRARGRGRQQPWRRARGAGGGAAPVRGGVCLPAPEPRDDGDDERHRALDAHALRGLDADAERRGRARRHVRGGRAAGGAMRGLQDQPRRRLRPARCGARLGAPGGGHRQGTARHAGQADLVARRGHAPRPLPPGDDVQAQGRAGRAGPPDGAAHAHLGPVDPGGRVPAEHPERPRPGGLPGPQRRRAPRRRSATACRTC